MAQPFRLVGMPFQPEAGDKGLVAANDHHDEQVGDHHDVDQAKHDQHDLLFAKVSGMENEVPKLLDEQEHIDALGHDQTQIQRKLRSEEHTSELQSLMRISYAVFCLKKTKKEIIIHTSNKYQNNE